MIAPVEEAAAEADQAEEELDDVICEECADTARLVPDPGRPSRGDIERHVAQAHVPFRPWCKHCVEGRAPDDPHRRQLEDEEGAVPKVSVDYCFLKAEEGDGMTRTVLVLHAKPSRVVAATCVVGKGREDPDVVPWVVAQVR